jgi:hypothetical protein
MTTETYTLHPGIPAHLSLEGTAKPGTLHYAVPMFDTVPEGCILHQVKDDAHSPHIRAGEHVVVNLNDRDFADGELFLIGFTGRTRVMQVVRRDRFGIDGVWFRPLNAPRNENELQDWLNEGRRLYAGDGPLRPECLDEYILGRVVGVFDGVMA